ncbi:MAG: pur operon repressor [Thermovenabulum sp.]|uniref:pur operon repressor n=1 Tax=Thermovenabulum sp. TaxID=3100335 RepID=UPI003C7A6C38
MRRSQRLVLITKHLTENPNKIIPLKFFAEKFNAAKSSISEDLNIIKSSFSDAREGILETIPGAAGGVRYKVKSSEEKIKAFLQELCDLISDKNRLIPGDYIYLTDIIFSPEYSLRIGEVIAERFIDEEPTCVLTVETKGIPLALMTARALNVPLVVARRDIKVTEGPSVNISYISGSSGRIQNMALPKRALSEKARVLIVDDFMKGGGTARGMTELVREFNAETVGIAVFIATEEPKEKLVKNYTTLLVLEKVETMKGLIKIRPGIF